MCFCESTEPLFCDAVVLGMAARIDELKCEKEGTPDDKCAHVVDKLSDYRDNLLKEKLVPKTQ